MTERDRGMNWPVANKNSLSKYIGPAVVLALATSIFYLFGMIYQSAYFGRFSFPYQSLNLPPAMYIAPIALTGLKSIYINIFTYEFSILRRNTDFIERILRLNKYSNIPIYISGIIVYSLFWTVLLLGLVGFENYLKSLNFSDSFGFVFASTELVVILLGYFLIRFNTIMPINRKNIYHSIIKILAGGYNSFL